MESIEELVFAQCFARSACMKRKGAPIDTGIVKKPHSTNFDMATKACIICFKHIADDARKIFCGFCKRVGHQGCFGLSDDVRNFFEKSGQKVHCLGCTPVVNVILDHENRLTACETVIADLKTRLSIVEAALHSDAPNTAKPAASGKTVEKTFRSLMAVEKVKECAILLNFPEIESSESELLENVQSLISELEMDRSAITACFRVGESPVRSDGSSAQRVVKVRLSSSQLKWSFINGINRSERVKNVEELQKLRARPDLTYDQRQKNRALSTELKRRMEAGEKNIFVDYKQQKIRSKAGPRQDANSDPMDDSQSSA